MTRLVMPMTSSQIWVPGLLRTQSFAQVRELTGDGRRPPRGGSAAWPHRRRPGAPENSGPGPLRCRMRGALSMARTPGSAATRVVR